MKLKLNSFLRNLLGTQGQPDASPLNPPLFITGSMRSGTTLIVDKLSSHPQLIKIGSELNEIWTEVGGAPMKGSCPHLTKENADPKYTYQMTNYIVSFLNDSKTLRRRLMRRIVKMNTKLGRVNYDWDNIIPVNKSPHLMNKLSYVNALFPESKNILIVRNIFAHSASMKVHFDNAYKNKNLVHVMETGEHSCWSDLPKAKFGNELPTNVYPSDFSLIPKMWLRLNSIALKEIAQLPKEKYLIVSYEKLVVEQESELRRIFDFLELREEYKEDENTICKSGQKMINTTTSGNPLDKWKKHLSEEEKSMIEKVIEEDADTYNFILSHLN